MIVISLFNDYTNRYNRLVFLHYTNIIRMTLQFEEKGLTKTKYTEDEHPLYMFLNGDSETRGDIILTHPDVIGFVYLHDDSIVKAFLPKRVVNFKATNREKRKVIVAVSGDTKDNIPFSISEMDLMSDKLHLTDCTSLNKSTPVISVATFVKENKDDLPTLPKEFNSEAKIKKLKIVSFPNILPIIKGYEFKEGPLESKDVYESIVDAHDLYSEWAFLQSKNYIITSAFSTQTEQCPVPDKASSNLTSFDEMPIKGLFRNNDKTSPFAIIKEKIEAFIKLNTNEEQSSKESSVPGIVNIDEKTSVSPSASSESSIQNERLTAFLQILFAKPNYNRNGELLSLVPAIVSDDVQEILESTTKISEQSRMVSDNIQVLAEDISKERNYLSRSSEFPFLSSTLNTYALQAHYHGGALDSNNESLKKSFSILALLPPPRNENEEYSGYVNSSKNNEVDRMLDQPEDKRTVMRKDVFIKGKQNTINDVLTFISNIIVFARFWVKIDKDDMNEMPYIIQMLIEIADFYLLQNI